jgi:hypothetical protein
MSWHLANSMRKHLDEETHDMKSKPAQEAVAADFRNLAVVTVKLARSMGLSRHATRGR